MPSVLVRCTTLATLVGAIGCANIHVQKVPLDARLTGTDEKVKGFRYYLSRPYILVKSKVTVAATQEYTRLVSVRPASEPGAEPRPALQALVPYNNEKFLRLYDTAGKELNPAEWTILGVYRVSASPSPAIPIPSTVTKIDKDKGVLTLTVGKAVTTVTIPVSATVMIDGLSGKKLEDIPLNSTVIITTQGGVVTKVEATSPPKTGATPLQSSALTLVAQPLKGHDTTPLCSDLSRISEVVSGPLGQPTPVVAPAGTVTSGERSPATQQKPNADTGDPAPVPDPVRDNIQVVSLPDFEEQYAIRNKNCMATSKYELHFTDGWQLDSTTGNWNSTQVPVRFLQSIENTIKAFTSYQTKAITDTQGSPSKGAADLAAEAARRPSRSDYIVIITRTYILEPGLYRLQKSWEKHEPEGDAPAPNCVCGLLTGLGLEFHQEVSIQEGSQNP